MNTEHGDRVATRRVGLTVTVLVAALALGACATGATKTERAAHRVAANAVAPTEVATPADAAPHVHAGATDGKGAGTGASVVDGAVGGVVDGVVDGVVGEGAATEVKALHRAGEIVEPGTGVGSFASMEEFLEFVLFDANDYWQRVFADYGIRAPFTYYVFPAPGEVFTSSCGRSNDATAYFCIRDDTIVLSQQRAADEAAYVAEVVGGGAGDMAAAFIVAHEFAHSLQSEMNFFDGRYTSLQTELQADCWAGVWAASAARRGMLDHDDLSEAAVLAWAVGSPDTADRDHGTSLERVDAFFQGFDTGHPLMCGEYLEAQP
jgi:predicted metalloprotease